MPNAFEVESVILSDYFTQDIFGKSVLAGIYGSELVFASAPPLLPLLIFTVTLKPVLPSFEAEITFSGPQTKPIVVFETNFHVEGAISQFARAIFNVQLPYLKFDGPGVYSIAIGSKGKKPQFRKHMNFMVGSGTVSGPGSISINLKHIAPSAAVEF